MHPGRDPLMMDSIRPVEPVGYSTRTWLPLFGVLLAMAIVAGGCTADEGSSPSEDGPSPAAPTSSAVATSTNSPPEPASASSAVATTAVLLPAPSSTAAPSSVATTTAPLVELSKEWTLFAGGDVLMDRTEPRGLDPFEFIEPALASADLAVVNAEMAISDRGVPANKRFVFRAPPSAARRMASAGIDVASLGNNHAKDYGSSALVDTVDLLEAAGVAAIGAGATDAEAYRYRVLRTAGDVSVAFVGVSMIVPWGFPAGPDSPGIASARPASRTVDSVREAAGAADVVIALVHWGIELTTCPNRAQRDFARELLDAGADAVIGHHPHVFAAGRVRRRHAGRLLAGQLHLAPEMEYHGGDRRAADRFRWRRDRRLGIPSAPAQRGRRAGAGHRGRAVRPHSRHHRRRLQAAPAASAVNDHHPDHELNLYYRGSPRGHFHDDSGYDGHHHRRRLRPFRVLPPPKLPEPGDDPTSGQTPWPAIPNGPSAGSRTPGSQPAQFYVQLPARAGRPSVRSSGPMFRLTPDGSPCGATPTSIVGKLAKVSTIRVNNE